MKALGFHRGPLVSIFHSDPIVTHMNDWCARGRLRPLRRLGRNVVAWGLYSLQRRYDVTIVSSESTERHLMELGINVKRIPFGVPVGFLDTPAPDRAVPGTSDGSVRLLYAGRLNQEKDVKLVLDSLPRLVSDPRVHVTVIGRGPLTPDFAAFQHPRYQFPGFIEDRDEVRRIFDAHDILLAPAPYETFGLAAIEGMARGLVLIAPNHGNTADLLRQAGSPFLFAAGEIDDFHAKVSAAVDSDRRLHSRRAREIAESYGSFRAAIERLTAFYVAMLQERGIQNS